MSLENEQIPLSHYLFNAIRDWIVDNGMTPQVLVDSTVPGVNVPRESLRPDLTVVLNISDSATRGLLIHQDGMAFGTRINGAHRDVYFPCAAVRAVFARETGQGMAFTAELRSPAGNPDLQDEEHGNAERLPESPEQNNLPFDQDTAAREAPPPVELDPNLRRHGHLRVVK